MRMQISNRRTLHHRNLAPLHHLHGKSLRKRLAITTYGLKHVCEKELENYVANDWIKAALYEGDYDLKEDYNETSDITLRDIFTNSVNFYFKVKK